MIPETKAINTRNFYETIDNFFDTASVGDYVKNQHYLLDCFLDSNTFVNSEIIRDIVSYTTTETNFLVKLKEAWEKHKEDYKIVI